MNIKEVKKLATGAVCIHYSDNNIEVLFPTEPAFLEGFGEKNFKRLNAFLNWQKNTIHSVHKITNEEFLKIMKKF